MSGANNEARRRLSDLIASGECGKGQHVLYDFLLELDGLTARFDTLDGRVQKLENETVSELVKVNKKLDEQTARQEKLEKDQAPLRIVMWAWEKAKSAGLLAVLIGWLFQDQPTVAAIIKALTH